MVRGFLARLAVLGGILAAVLAPASAHAVNFTGPTNFAVPPSGVTHGIQSVAAGDFNGDTDPDLAVAHQDGDKISVLLGSTGGTFTAPTDFALFSSANPLFVAIGNFNGDTDPDLAVANEGSSTGSPPGNVSVLLGSTGGSFTGPTNFTAGTRPQSVGIGDFNGDSDPDLAVANETSNNVSVLLGGAGGSFGAATNYATGITSRSVGVGDFNGDTDPDLAVLNKDSDNVSILLGGAGGTFGAATNFGAGFTPHALAVGEFNGDSDPDIAVVNETTNAATILLGGSGGSFGAATSFSVGTLPDALAIGHFNSDSDADIAVANQSSDNVSVLLGSTGGSFTAATNFTAADAPTSVAVGQFNLNNDSYPDLAVTNEISNDVSILLGVNPLPYPRPQGGSPVRVPLVPVLNQCTSPNSTHGGTLPTTGSCTNPALVSTTVTLGSSTSGFARLGHARVLVCPTTSLPGCSGIGTAPDVRLFGNGSDVVCAAGAPAAACPLGAGSDYDPNSAAGPYTSGLDLGTNSNTTPPTPICNPGTPNPPACAAGADMTAIAEIPGSTSPSGKAIRVTDAFNVNPSTSDPPACGSTTSCSATVRDQAFSVPVVCKATADATIGSYCGANTTANALVPGVVLTGKAALVEIGQIRVLDSGPDGVRNNADDQPLAVQGIFVP